MTTAMTKPSDIYSPEVVAGVSSEIIMGTVNLLTSGYVKDARKTAIRDGAARTVSFPYLEDTGISVKTNPRDNTKIEADKVSLAYEPETIVSKAINIHNDKKALDMLSRSADPNQLMAEIVANRMQTHIQSALITEGASSSLSFTDQTGKASIAGIKKAMISKLGDKASKYPPLVLLHSRCSYDLETSDEVQKLGIYGGLRPGEITNIANMFFLMLDDIDFDAGTSLYNNLIIMPNAIQLWLESTEAYAPERLEGTTTYESLFSFDFCTNLTRSNPGGVINYLCASTIAAS